MKLKKLISIILISVMALSCVSMPAFSEEEKVFEYILDNSNYGVVEGSFKA